MADRATKTTANKEAEQVTFDFTSAPFEVSVEIPEKLPVQRATGLPFKEMYALMEPLALEGKQPHRFVPTAFWVARAKEQTNGNAEKAQTAAYGKGKLREQFNQWVKEDEAKRGKLNLIMIERKGTEKEVFDQLKVPAEHGLSVWLTKS